MSFRRFIGSVDALAINPFVGSLDYNSAVIRGIISLATPGGILPLPLGARLPLRLGTVHNKALCLLGKLLVEPKQVLDAAFAPPHAVEALEAFGTDQFPVVW